MNKTIHHGRNVKRIREIFGIKPETFAQQLGSDWDKKKITLLESKETIDDALMEQVAKALKVPADAIKNFDEEKTVFNTQNNYEGSNAGASNVGVDTSGSNIDCIFHPLEEMLKQLESIAKLHAALLKEKDEKIALLERMLEMKK